MKYGLTLYCLILLAPLAKAETIYSNPGLCDFHDRVCVNIRIHFSEFDKVMEIRGRLYRPAGKGDLIFFLSGITPLNEQIEHQVSIPVKGWYNEIINKKFQPPLSSETEWTLKELVFDPEND